MQPTTSLGLSSWNRRQGDYPFHAQEDRNGNRVPYNADQGKRFTMRYGEHIRCHAPEIGVTFWGFLTEKALQDFLHDYDLPDERGKGGPA